MITIDQRGCGEGKTTLGIYKMLTYFKLTNQKALVIVPSKELQAKYKQDFPEAVVINSDVVSNTTTQEINRLMEQGKELVIITHAAFVRLNDTGFHSYYNLIIDEALQDIVRYKYVDFSGDSTLATIHWEKRFEPTKITKEFFDLNETNTWHQMNLIDICDESIINESQTYREIVDPNHIHYMRKSDYDSMMNHTGFIHFLSQLDIKVLDNWKSIHIASAAFEKTSMYHWLKAHNIKTRITTQFKPKQGNIHIYTSHDPKFKWSKTKLDKYETLMDEFHKEVEKYATGKIISLRNNSRTEKLSNERKLSHNVHGINDDELKSLVNISVESALIPKPIEYDFICQIFNFDKPRSNETRQKIKHMYMYHLFYQVIMRCKLRDQSYNNEQVNIFCPDQDIAVGLSFYFDFVNSVEMNFTDNSGIKKPMTAYERVKKFRNKNKLNASPKSNINTK